MAPKRAGAKRSQRRSSELKRAGPERAAPGRPTGAPATAAPPGLARWLAGTLARPGPTFRALAELPEGTQLRIGLRAVLLIGVLYTGTVVGLWATGASPAVAPWIAIASEAYYLWEIFFTIPVFIVGWVLGAGLVQLVGRALGGRGSFERSAGVLGLVMFVPTSLMWVIETTLTGMFLTGVLTREGFEVYLGAHPWVTWAAVAYQGAAGVWYLTLAPMAAGAAQRLGGWRAAVAGGVPTLVVLALMVLFIR